MAWGHARGGGPSTSDVVEQAMADVWFVLLTVALFAVIGLVARGVERL
jgi:hypothetical protein